VGDCEKDIGEVVAFLCSDAASYFPSEKPRSERNPG
jgi:hypothetical protein